MKKTFTLKILAVALPLLIGGLWFSSKIDSPFQKNGCPFCIDEIIQSQLVFEGKEVLAMTTHKPALEGHLLIIPKRHVERFEELTSSEIAEMGEMIKKVDSAVKRVFKTTGYLLIQKNGREVGQSVPHVHFHYLPASKETGQTTIAFKFFTSPWFSPKTRDELASVISKLQKEGIDQSPLILD